MTPSLAQSLSAFGFAVIRQFFKADAVSAEVDRVTSNGLMLPVARRGGINFQYVPMMTAETPASLSLLDACAVLAEAALMAPVIPTRAKGTLYRGDTPWHVDSESHIQSIGCIAYLESINARSGALRVLPGSHRPEYGDAIRALGATGMPATALPAHVIESEPGDLILMDEHLFHASFSGGVRRQWRVDFLPLPTDADAERDTKTYFEQLYPPDWEGGYDVDRYPSYGPDWIQSGRGSVGHLAALGVYDLAAAQEAFSRNRSKHET
jgi:hypothetical protein